eukprot:TRINITY_DN6584_c0_g1_i1.p1 TRINITY_DN6584_c0_g1~~TRINITY_DN6584_c0_g1_i1.p1  ORF type:complete len:194 (+),score=29.32 TRINITY_DN6584_c0_g1_i1:56-583(+)
MENNEQLPSCALEILVQYENYKLRIARNIDDCREELMSHINAHKTSGNQYFTDKNYAKAVDSYLKAIKMCPIIPELYSIIATIYSNISECYLQMEKPTSAYIYATCAKWTCPTSNKRIYVKSCHRRFRALYDVKNHFGAVIDYLQVEQELNKTNPDPYFLDFIDAREECTAIPCI